jgi:malate dehydrogenase (oxaloacetate-decarboxylating)
MSKNNQKKSADFAKLSIKEHLKHGGKIFVGSKFKLVDKKDLSIAYTPGVAEVCTEIAKDKTQAKKLTLKKNTVAILSNGTAVLGLGNIGAEAAIPVMEGKAVLLKHFAGVDAFPICINTDDVEEVIKTVKNIQAVFGGINLEDISAPNCFEIEERLKTELDIPVMHDDQWGAATVTIAGIINALKVVKKKSSAVSVALVGAGAAGIATAKLLQVLGVKNLTVFDTKGAIHASRTDLNKQKQEVLSLNTLNIKGELKENIEHFDIFIGLSKPNLLNSSDVSKMKKDPIIFALANPTPEIMPDEAKKGGAKVVGTGRSDFPNQINNSLFFPGYWKGMLERSNKNKPKFDFLTEKKMYIKCAEAIAKMVKPTPDRILPSTLDKKVHIIVAKVVTNFK